MFKGDPIRDDLIGNKFVRISLNILLRNKL